MAPEIIRIRDCDDVRLSCISDMFSAGAIFYQILFDRPLFCSKEHGDVLALNRSCDIRFSDRLKQLITAEGTRMDMLEF